MLLLETAPSSAGLKPLDAAETSVFAVSPEHPNKLTSAKTPMQAMHRREDGAVLEAVFW